MAVELQRWGRAGWDQPVDAQTFAAWLNKRVETYEAEAEREAQLAGADGATGAIERLAAELGVATRTLHRYRRCLNGENERTDSYPRSLIEQALERADVPFWEVFPDVDDDPGAMEDRWCRSCKDLVTVGEDGVSPWCEHATESARGREKRWCKRCDRLLFPADDGSCWRCGEQTKRRAPDIPCKCGCTEMRPRFDGQGRRADYVRGHAPRARSVGTLDIGPFRAWLIGELRALDPIEALAKRTGLTRDEVQLVLNARVDELEREKINRALWSSGRGGTVGKGAVTRPGAPKLGDLYPNDVRTRTCPSCGNTKAPHAELCKRCRVQRNRATGVPHGTPRTQLGEHVLEEAKRMYDAGATFRTMAEVLFERVPHSSAESLAATFSREFGRRGWKTRARTPRAA